MIQVLVVRVDIGVLTYEAMTPPVLEVIGSGPDCQSGNRSVIYEAMIPQCERSVIQVLVVRVDIGVVTMKLLHPSVGGQWLSEWIQEW